MKDNSAKDQLVDVVVTLSYVALSDDEVPAPYATTVVFRAEYDNVDNPRLFVERMLDQMHPVTLSQMRSE